MGCGASAKKARYDPFEQSPKLKKAWTCPECAHVNGKDESKCGGCSKPLSASLSGSGGPERQKSEKKEKNLRQSIVYTVKANIDADFDIKDEPFGAGHTGSVFECKERESGESFVVKLIMRRGRSLQELEKELDIQKSLDHPHICRVYQAYGDARCFYVIMEHLKGGSLIDRAVQEAVLSEAVAARLVRQLVTAVAHMHKNYICHGDVKPENAIFSDYKSMSEGVLKLIDFGHAQRFKSESVLKKRKDAAKRSWYTAPEVFEDAFTPSCDVYSLGILAHVLVAGSAPFWGGDKAFKDDQSARGKRQRKSVLSGLDLPKDKRGLASPIAFDFVERCVCREAKRMDITQVLAHQFLDHALSTAPISPTLLTTLQGFHKHTVLERTALTHFARHLDASATDQLRRVFQKFDSNGDGTLNREEFAKGLAPLGFPAAMLDATFDTLDTDGSDSIDYTEFLGAALATKEVQDEVKWWGVFRQFDSSGDGRLSCDELVFVLSGGRAERFEDLGALADDAEIRATAEELKDGIGFDEFLVLMRSAKAAVVKSSKFYSSCGSPSPQIEPSGSNFFSQRGN